MVNSISVETNTDTLENVLDNGLMDSAWPMFQHDNKHTGRSPYGVLSNDCVVKWGFNMSGLTYSSPSIDKNGTIYIGALPMINSINLFALNPDGSLKWSFDTDGGVFSSPAIASDGTIYVGSNGGYLYAVYPNGTLKWRFKVGGSADWVFSSPAVDYNGTIYFGVLGPGWNIGRIYAVNSDGTEKWHYDTGDWIYSSPAIDDNGIVYIGSHDGYMYAIHPNGTLKWKYKTRDSVKSSPSIGDDGTIYFGSWDNYLYALYPNSTLKWKFDTGNSVDCSPAIDLDGNIYIGSYSDWFYSVSSDGIENWRFRTGDSILSSPIIDKFGIIYICSTDGNLYVLNPDGSIRWVFVTGDNNFIESTPAVGEDGTIYICTQFIAPLDYSYLYAVNPTVVHKPSNPTINGEQYGGRRVEYTYSVSCFHQDGYNVSYFIDWGDGTNSGWTDFVSPGILVNVSHTWMFQGYYTIRAKAKDIYGAESDWSTLKIILPKNKMNILLNSLLDRLLNYLSFIYIGGIK